MKKLIISQVNLLEPQSKSVLVALSHKMVNSDSLMIKLAENMIDIPLENEIYFRNIRRMMENESFKERYDSAIVNTTLSDEDDDPFGYELY